MKTGVISQKDFDATWEFVVADEEAIRADERKKIVEMIGGMRKRRGKAKNKRVSYRRGGDLCYQCGKDISNHSVRAIYCFECAKQRSLASMIGGYGYNNAIDDILKKMEEK